MSSFLVRYKANLSYDGTNFTGFQRQVKARTVQGEVETALQKLGWQQNTILAAGRTDRGAHASGQVIAFDLLWKHSPADLLHALNRHLPPDIAIQNIREIRSDFHPRFDALSRCYQYTLVNCASRDPLRERYAWRAWPKINFDILVRATAPLIGTHDFKAFGSPPQPGGNTIRNVIRANWKQISVDEIRFDVEANAFLFHMVRRIVRLVVDVAQNRLPVEKVISYLMDSKSVSVKGLAPPHGLNLIAVYYSEQDM